jgi:hypothetical protein
LKRLLRDLAQVQKASPHIRSDSRLCRILAEKQGNTGERAKQRGRTLHRKVIDARKAKPLSETELDWLIDGFLEELFGSDEQSPSH